MQLLELETQAGITHHFTGPARKAAQSGEFKRWVVFIKDA